MPDYSATSIARRLARRVRQPTARVGRFASRLNRVTRYGLDLMLWSRLLDRRLDAVPVELARTQLDKKSVVHTPPKLSVGDPSGEHTCWEEGFAGVYATLLLNLNNPDTLSPVRYAHPAPSFQGVFLWDSAFIAQVWRDWDPGAALDVVDAVLQLRDGDRLQHVVAEFSQSIYTQPPVLAWSIAQLSGRLSSEHRDRLRASYGILTDYHYWLNSRRRLPGGLYAWAHPYESGIDNSPRFSNRDESEFADTTKLASPDSSSYVVLQLESLAALARQLDLCDEHHWRSAADELRRRINNYLWCDADACYYDRDTRSGEFVRIETIASLLPLWAGVPDQQRAGQMVEAVRDSERFGTPIPLPSVSRSSDGFDKDMWRGPVWLNTAYAVVRGLVRYGYLEEAGETARRLCDGVYQTFGRERRFFEFYDPDGPGIDHLGRKRGNRWKHLTLGAKPVGEFVGWTGLVNTMVCDTLVGFHRTAKRRYLRPLLPKTLRGVAFSLRLPSEQLEVTVEREEDRILGVARTPDRTQRFAIEFGGEVDLDRVPDDGRQATAPQASDVLADNTPPGNQPAFTASAPSAS